MNSENFNVKFGEVMNTGGGTSDFNQLTNRPKYDGATMTGDTNIPKVPTTTSELTNNSGFITGTELGAEATAREQADNTLQGEIDGLDNSKADKSTTYTKTEVDTALDAKADKSTTYTKTEVDTALDLKADKSTTYTKTETDGLIGEIAGKIKILTTDDYNWPVDNPTGIAPWLLDEGWYTGEDGVRLYQSPTGSTYITLYKGKTFYIGVGTGPGGDQYYRTKYIYRIGEHALADDGGVYRSVYAWITWFANDNSGTQTMYFPSLADLSERVVQKAGAPTTSSEGVLGQLWEDSSNGELYQLKSIDTSVTPNTYTWEQVGGGTNDFNQLINLPKYDSATMSGNTNIPKVPTATSELTNDSGFITSSALPTVNDATLTITQNGTSKGTFTANDADDTTIALTDTTYSDFTGTDGSAAGAAGLVPAPATTDTDKYLKSDGTWAEVQGGGGPTVVQTTGTSTTDVMSQNAVTSMVFADPARRRRIRIGQGNTGSDYGIGIGDYANTGSREGATAIGKSAGALAADAIALGTGAIARDYAGSIALGAYSGGIGIFTAEGIMHIGTSIAAYGYNNSNYRLLRGVYDGQEAHDAATVGQITPTTDSSAPTAATAGRLGEIRIDTTTNTAYMCVLSDSTTPAYEWKQITA